MQGNTSRVLSFYLLQNSVLSKRVIFPEHKRSLHGGVVITISHVRSFFWIRQLRRLSKSVITNCYGCKKIKSRLYHSPKPGPLPEDRTEKRFYLRLQAQTMRVQFIIKPKRKVSSKHISYYFLAVLLEPCTQSQYPISPPQNVSRGL